MDAVQHAATPSYLAELECVLRRCRHQKCGRSGASPRRRRLARGGFGDRRKRWFIGAVLYIARSNPEHNAREQINVKDTCSARKLSERCAMPKQRSKSLITHPASLLIAAIAFMMLFLYLAWLASNLVILRKDVARMIADSSSRSIDPYSPSPQ